MRDTRNEANAADLAHVNVEKSLGALKQEQAKLSKKLKEADQARQSVEASLKIMERQVEDSSQKLHLTEIDLSTER